MLVLTNGLAETPDEGFLKVANNLIKRLKENCKDVEVVSFERNSAIADTCIKPNKLLLDKCVREVCSRHNSLLYVPFPTRKWVMALRVYVLSKYIKKVNVVLVLKTPIGVISRFLLKQSGANIIVLSRDAAEFYGKVVGESRIRYVNAGVDINRFVPVSRERSSELKKKYGFDPQKIVVLHVGHLNEGRNLRQLQKLCNDYQILIVASTQTKFESDTKLKSDLLSKRNVIIIDKYVPNIQELYQLADVYFFPVTQSGHCIDAPLSCLEAAACGKPVVTTSYGEMREFKGKSGFWFIESFEPDYLNSLIFNAACDCDQNPRNAVAIYDWGCAVQKLRSFLEGE